MKLKTKQNNLLTIMLNCEYNGVNIMNWFKIKDFLYRLPRPHCWISNHPSDECLDEFINLCIDNNLFINPDENNLYNTVRVGDKSTHIWTSNYPYAYGYIYTSGCTRKCPSFRTRKRLRNYLRQQNKGDLRVERLIAIIKNSDNTSR